MFDNALAALDLSPAEQPILDCLPALRHWVECVHVLAADADSAPYPVRIAMDRLIERIEARGARATGTLLEGKSSAGIARHAQNADATLIVIGKYGRNRVAGRLIGSTAANLCEIAGRPVLMVP